MRKQTSLSKAYLPVRIPHLSQNFIPNGFMVHFPFVGLTVEDISPVKPAKRK